MEAHKLNTIVMTVESPILTNMDYVREYTKRCTDSLDKFGMKYEIFYGPVGREENQVYIDKFGFNMPQHHGNNGCILSHAYAFDQVIQRNEPLIILEFDAIIEKHFDFDVKDGHYYRLHQIPYGHGQLVTPAVAKKLIANKQNNFKGLRDSKAPTDEEKYPYTNWDHHIKHNPQEYNTIVKPGYVGGNEINSECTRFPDKRNDTLDIIDERWKSKENLG